MQSSKKVLIWIPLPPGSHWRGEGIAQTIENIVANSPADIQYCLAVSGDSYGVIREALAHVPNVTAQALSLIPTHLHAPIKTYDATSVLKLTFRDYFKFLLRLRGVNRLTSLYNRTRYGMFLFVCTQLQRHGLVFADYDTVWLPSPTIPFSEKLRGKLILSFWDPFVFEYREFSDIAGILVTKVATLMRNVSLIITQSHSNKRYLINVLGMSADRIRVIFNGSPDYRPIIDQHFSALTVRPLSYDDIFACWPDKSLISHNRIRAMQIMVGDRINKSILFRLASKLSPATKIVLISTQNRPHKGFAVLFKVLDACLNQNNGHEIQFIFTSPVPKDIRNKYPWVSERVHEITRVSNSQHAALYAMSDLALHPSFVEGGPGSYPQFEAASANIPALNNTGRHTREQLEMFGIELSHTMVDFTDTDAFVQRFYALLNDTAERARNIAATRSASATWQTVGAEYAATFRAVTGA